MSYETLEAIKALRIWKVLWYRTGYRPFQRWAHRHNWHHMRKMPVIERGKQDIWCEWCGARYSYSTMLEITHPRGSKGLYVEFKDYEILAEQYQTYREVASASIGAELGQAADRIDRLERERDGAINRLLPLGLEVERLRKALESIAAHNHGEKDELGNVIILQGNCPACTPTTTARAALRSPVTTGGEDE